MHNYHQDISKIKFLQQDIGYRKAIEKTSTNIDVPRFLTSKASGILVSESSYPVAIKNVAVTKLVENNSWMTFLKHCRVLIHAVPVFFDFDFDFCILIRTKLVRLKDYVS